MNLNAVNSECSKLNSNTSFADRLLIRHVAVAKLTGYEQIKNDMQKRAKTLLMFSEEMHERSQQYHLRRNKKGVCQFLFPSKGELLGLAENKLRQNLMVDHHFRNL